MSPNQMEELIPIAQALNTESDEINTTITTLNKKRAELNFGIEVWLDQERDNPEQIGFAKIDSPAESSWQLATRWNGNAVVIRPLFAASRKTRIEALRMLPDILQQLKWEAERSLETIRAAKKMAAEL